MTDGGKNQKHLLYAIIKLHKFYAHCIVESYKHKKHDMNFLGLSISFTHIVLL